MVASSAEKATLAVGSQMVGLLSTWNQECGLATYAKYLLSQYREGSYVVLAEDTDKGRICSDETFVERCWRRRSTDFNKLESAIQRHNIKLLHINGHYLFFQQPAFGQFLARLRGKGVACVLQLHTVYQLDEQISALVQNVDLTVVHSAESRLEAIANGAKPDSVQYIQHGVHVRPELDERARQNLRLKLQMPVGEKVLVAFGFIQPHKGMEGLIEAIARLRDRGIAARGYIAGKAKDDDPYSMEYVQELTRMAQLLNVQDRVHILNRYLDDAEVSDYLAAADVVLMNYRSQHYEASGACSLAVGAGAVVAASVAPPFAGFGDAVWHITSGYSAAVSLESLVTNQQLHQAVKERARRYCQKNAWPKVVHKFARLYKKLGFVTPIRKKENAVESPKNSTTPRGSLRILMQMRPNAYSQRGGDTVVMDQLANGLRSKGIDVVIDLECRENPVQFDLVHLFNFATADHTRALAQRAQQSGKPYVVTTLYEDTPAYRNQAITQASQLVEYVQRMQNKNWWEQNAVDVTRVSPAQRFENSWTAEHAAALFTNGSQESKVIKRDYPRAGRIIEIKLGHELGANEGPEAFMNAHGVQDFVLCVGRFEFRKNQLMLLKALEDSPLTVVLAGGGFSYDPDYDRAVRNFKRKGPTIILDRISPQMLSSAYAAARVHALPSWYELPGLVSLEAAHHGCQIVVGNQGTSSDYFGAQAFYCDAWNESSVRNAVMAAYYAPKNPELQTQAASYSWERCVEETVSAYGTVLGVASELSTPQVQVVGNKLTANMQIAPAAQSPMNAAEFTQLMERGEAAAMNEQWSEAHSIFEQAERMNPTSGRALKSRGTIFLAEGKHTQARSYFQRAHTIDAKDSRSISGLGMCELRDGSYESAYSYFLKALELDSKHLPTLLQFMECAYNLQRFPDLERILRRYVSERPEDLEMQFCLAGVCYKMGRLSEADELCRRILQSKPTHTGATELQDLLKKQNITLRPQQTTSVSPATDATAVRASFVPVAGASAIAAPPVSSNFEVEMQKAEDLKRDRKLTEAKQVCTGFSAINLNPQQKERLLTLQAEFAVLEERVEEAAAIYEQVQLLNPSSPRMLCGKGALAAHSGRWDDARRFFEDALRAKPEYDVALAGMGLCCSWFKEHERAWEFYTRATKVNPENARALLGIVELGYPMKRLSDVETAVRAYLEMHPLDFEFLYALAGCLYAQGKLDEATEELRKITLFEPNNRRALELQNMIDEKAKSENLGQRASISAS